MVRNLAGRTWVAIGLVATASSFAIPARGQLIAHDGFEDAIYSDNGPTLDDTPLQQTGPFADQGNPLVTPGWDGPSGAEGIQTRKWVSNGTINYRFDLESLQNSAVGYDDNSTGKAEFLSYDNPGTLQFRSIRRVVDAYDPADTYYMSFFLNTSSVPTAQLGQRGQAMVGFTNGVTESQLSNAFNNAVGAPTLYGLMVGFDGRGTDQRISDLVLRSRNEVEDDVFQFTNSVLLTGEVANPEAPADQQVSTLENLTHHVLLKLEVNTNEEGMDQVTYWVNPTDVSSEALATSSAQATGSIETFSMDLNTHMTRLQAVVNRYEDRSFYFDEPRLGYDFLSVVGSEPSTGIVGDFNDDQVVNAADYAVWRDNLDGTAMLPNDDSPGAVDPNDYSDWKANFGLTSNGGNGSQAVPEPGIVPMLIALVGGLVFRGRSSLRIR